MSTIAYIPARGGSKGIPRKNMLNCAGKPLLQWSVDAAKASKLVDYVVVSSDDDDILLAAELYGAIPQHRSAEASNATAQIEEGLIEFIDSWSGADIKALVILQPTSPQREGWQIDEAINLLSQTDSVVGVVSSHSLQWKEHSAARPMFDRAARPRRQDMDEVYEECGSLYVTTPHILKFTGVRAGGRVALYVMRESDRYQIDSPFDLAVVEGILVARYATVS